MYQSKDVGNQDNYVWMVSAVGRKKKYEHNASFALVIRPHSRADSAKIISNFPCSLWEKESNPASNSAEKNCLTFQ